MTSHQVQQFLEKCSYKYIDSAKTDILGALREFKDLLPEQENFMFPDGKRRQTVKLRGTIPVHYKGNCYNIPVTVYLWDTHPYYAPICFVNPTSTMVIKESENVNRQGRVFLPYLKEWRFPGYDLNGLLQVMAMVFQERCPLFAKPAGGSSASSATSTPTPSSQSTPTPYPSTTPYPSSGVGIPPYPVHNPSPYPSSTPYSVPYPSNSPYPTPYANLPQPARPPLPTPRTSSASFGRPTPPPVPPPPTSNSSSTGAISAEHIRNSILSAIEDKLRMRIRDKVGTSHAEMESIQQTQVDLRNGQQKLKTITETLETQLKDVESFIFTYQAKKAELERAVAESCGDAKSSIDDAIDAGTPLHRQLFDHYSKDLACDDAVYALGQQLRHGKLSLSEYLKQVRNVSRKQFIHRATMQKCRREAGLPV